MRDTELADLVFREDTAGAAADKFVDADDDIAPTRGLERRIVDVLDQVQSLAGCVYQTESVTLKIKGQFQLGPRQLSFKWRRLILRSEDIVEAYSVNRQNLVICL